MNPLARALRHSRVVAVAVLDLDGRALHSNELFDRLAGTPSRAADALSAPNWTTLQRQLLRGPVEGLFTLSGPHSAGATLRGRASREGDTVVLVVEADLPDVLESNERLAELNREASVLQRELARQKVRLQATLDELRATEARLVHSHKMRGLSRLAGGMAHELNSPLTAVLLSAEVLDAALRDPVPDPETLADARDCAATIRDAGLAVSAIVQRVRRFSGQPRRGVAEADLIDCVDTALLTVAQLAANRGVTLSVSHEGPPAGCPAGPGMCAALAEVARNAVQFSPLGGRVEVKTWTEAAHACVSFRDQGPGVGVEPPERVFEPFFTTRAVGDGPGLGLSVAWGVVVGERGGELTLQDAHPGTRALLRVPLVSPDACQS